MDPDAGVPADVPPAVAVGVRRYLERADRAWPGRITGFYLVGSTALGAFRAGRSDIDFIAVVDGPPTADEVRRLRRVQRRLHDRALIAALPGRRWPLVCNGCYVQWPDFERPPAEVTPVASHVAREFTTGGGFDVNPVTWRILATRGIRLRGPDVSALDVHDDPAELHRWNRDNLNGYWRRWASAARRRRGILGRLAPLGHVWAALGAPRLHYTLTTGEIASKEQAGEYALDVFGPEWHPLVRSALAYWRDGRPALRPAAYRRPEVADFVDMVIDDANRLTERPGA